MNKNIKKTSHSNLSIRILGSRFSNPVMLASGTLAESESKTQAFLRSQIGAVVPRTTREQYAPGRDHHPSPHLDIDEKNGVMRNAEWTGAPITYWKPFLSSLSKTQRVIMAVSGRDIAGCVRVCKELDSFHFPFLEINVSCAHSNKAHGFITRNEKHIKALVKALKKQVKTPIALKLGHSDFIVPLAKAAEEAGVDAIVAINTYGPVIDFEINKGVPQYSLGIAGGSGGLSGKPLFHIALTDVFELAQHLSIPIIACGGISTPEDVIKMIMAGASAVQVYSAAHLQGKKAPAYFDALVDGLGIWMKKHQYKKIADIKGLAIKLKPKQHQMEILTPRLLKKKCAGCRKCMNICLEDAITFVGKKPKFCSKTCIGCGACVSICPQKALHQNK